MRSSPRVIAARKFSPKILKYHDPPLRRVLSFFLVFSFSDASVSFLSLSRERERERGRERARFFSQRLHASIFNPSPLGFFPTTHRTLHHTRPGVHISCTCTYRSHAHRCTTTLCPTPGDPLPAGNGVNNTEIYLFTGINHRELYE